MIYQMRASTWVGLILGFVLGGVITWWVYYRQKKISKQQDDLLEKVKELAEKNVILEESHEKMLKSIEEFQKHQETALCHSVRKWCIRYYFVFKLSS